MSGRVQIKRETEKQYIIIPLFSVIRKVDGDYVFIAENNKAAERKIQVGNTFGDRVEVTGGITPGEFVIITRISTLISNNPVIPRTVGASGEWK
jgi:multidrug efflux pump subunit AcrA (membrane-fusion protein)